MSHRTQHDETEGWGREVERWREGVEKSLKMRETERKCPVTVKRDCGYCLSVCVCIEAEQLQTRRVHCTVTERFSSTWFWPALLSLLQPKLTQPQLWLLPASVIDGEAFGVCVSGQSGEKRVRRRRGRIHKMEGGLKRRKWVIGRGVGKRKGSKALKGGE